MNKQPSSTELAAAILSKPRFLGRALFESMQTRRLLRIAALAKEVKKFNQPK